MPLLNTIPREAAAYTSIYHGRTILLKIEDTEIDGPSFPQLLDDIQYLNASGVGIILAAGGDAETRLKLAKALPNGILLDPKSIACRKHPNEPLGPLGIPIGIDVPNEPLVIAGFTGEADGERVNVNASDVAMQIATQYREEIEELIILTQDGGIANAAGETTSLLTEKRIDRILTGDAGDIVATAGVRNKLMEVRRALQVINKVVVTNTGGLREEIEKWMGSGTLCVDTQRLEASRMRFTEADIFDAVYATYVEKGIFRPRTADQLNELKIHHRVLRAGNSPLGGFSVVPRAEYLELSGVWAGTIGNGIGRMLLDAAHAEAGRRKMYALSTNDDAIRTFSNHPGFESVGQLAQLRASSADRIPEPLSTYNTDARNPHLFLKRKI